MAGVGVVKVSLRNSLAARDNLELGIYGLGVDALFSYELFYYKLKLDGIL